MKKQVAGVVVLYNPDKLNINTYIQDLGRLYVVDNSERELSANLKDYLTDNETIEYIRFGENKGIAAALNEGAKHAIKDGFKWLLTMDQDSKATPDMVRSLYDFAVSGQTDDRPVGIVASIPGYLAGPELQNLPEWEIVQEVITSGNLVRLSAWEAAGGWDEKLFIDSVDYDFGFRVQLVGYVIVRLNRFVFPHALGEIREYRLFGHKFFSVLHHNYIRRYYITRNRLYINKTYKRTFPRFVASERLVNLKEFFKILLYESDKRRKFRSMFRGWRDYHKGIWGKYRW